MNLQKYFVLCVLLIATTINARKSAITFSGGGRLGDKLISYCKAKWLAYKYNLDFFCPHFPFKEELMLDTLEKPYDKKIKKKFKHKVLLTQESDIDPKARDTLYVSPFHIQPKGLESGIGVLETFNKHPELLAHIKTTLAPRQAPKPICIPEGMPSIALHIRRGGGYDQPLLHGTIEKPGIEYADKIWPKRFPPDEYYIQQLSDMLTLFPEDQDVYVHFFTDDPHPEEMVAKYAAAIGRDSILFGYRAGNCYETSILEDLFGMTQFDYIIRSTSSFSFMAVLLGNHKRMIWPKFAEWHDNFLTIVRVWSVDRLVDNTITKLSVTVEYDECNTHE